MKKNRKPDRGVPEMLVRDERDKTQLPQKSLDNLAPGDHLCCIHETDQEYHRVLAEYIWCGLKQNQKVLYIVGDNTKEDIRKILASRPITVREGGRNQNSDRKASSFIDSGRLRILTGREFYLNDGVFNPRAIVSLLQEESERAVAEGYSALRVVEEMGWAGKGYPGSELLMEYESLLNEFLPQSRCLVACLYDRLSFPPPVLLEALNTHPIAIIGTNVYKNIYYIPADEHSPADRVRTELNHRLGILAERDLWEKRLRESADRVNSLFQNNPDAVYTFDTSGIFLSVNKAACEMTGYWEDEIVGSSFESLVSTDHLKEVKKRFLEVVRGDIKHYEASILTKGGERLDLDVTNIPMIVDGRIVGVYGIAKDITARNRVVESLRESEERYRDLFENASIGIFHSLPEGRFLRVNPVVARIMGYNSPDEMVSLVTDIATELYMDSGRRKELLSEIREKRGWSVSEVQFRRKDGRVITADFSMRPVLGRDGSIEYLEGYITDITEKKAAEEALVRERNRAQQYLDISGVMIVVLDTAGVVTLINKMGCEILGYAESEIVGKNWFDHFIPTDEGERVKIIYANVMAGRQETYKYVENAILCKDGTRRTIAWRNTIVTNENGSIVASLSSGEDITEQKKLEALLRLQRDIGLFLGEGDDIDLVLSEVMNRIHSIEEIDVSSLYLMNDRTGEVSPAASRGVFRTYLEMISVVKNDNPLMIMAREGKPFYGTGETILDELFDDYRRREGMRAFAIIPIHFMGDFIGVFNLASRTADEFSPNIRNALETIAGRIGGVLVRLRMQALLKESEGKWRNLFESSKDVVYLSSVEGRFIEINPAGEVLFGYTREELLNINLKDLYNNPARRTEFQEEIVRAGFVKDYEVSFRRKDGTVIDCFLTSTIRTDKHGTVIGYQGTIRDITERKKMIEALRESEEKFRNMFEKSPDFMFITRLDGTIIDMNESTLRFFGYLWDDLAAMNIVDFYAFPRQREVLTNDLLKKGFVENYEIKLKKKDGSIVDTLATIVVCRDKNGKTVGYQGIVHDITERIRFENHMLQTEKLSSMGTMISGIAHELNNPLTSIIGHTQLLMRKDVSDNVKTKLDIIFKESTRASKIVGGLLAFAREHKPERRMIDINEIIMEAFRLREYDLRVCNIDTRLSLAADLPQTLADPYQLQQVFINIINNAQDALAGQSEGAFIIRTFQKDGKLIIEFEDNGPGIPAEYLRKIFDPFFTTKDVGKGTGMGLSIAYGIIREHGGHIDVESVEGRGTKFVFEIPIVEKPDEFANSPKLSRGRTGRTSAVLVVEDEDSLREMIIEALTDAGYHAEGAESGENAIDLIGKKAYDIVISDMKMPGIGGKELYTYIQKNNAPLADRVLFVTGDVLSRETQTFLRITKNRYLEKPFNIDRLLSYVGEMTPKPNR